MKIKNQQDGTFLLTVNSLELSELLRGLRVADHEGQPYDSSINDLLREIISEVIE